MGMCVFVCGCTCVCVCVRVFVLSIEMFKATCDELQEWIKEKKNNLATDDLGKDLKATQALQRKHAVRTDLTDLSQ